jgi:hypothetical protein
MTDVSNRPAYCHKCFTSHSEVMSCIEAWAMTRDEEEIQPKTGPRKAGDFLAQASSLMQERGKQYDQPGGERSMGRAIKAFNVITGSDLTEYEGWLLMSLLKRVRQCSGPYHKDSAEDAVAYAALEAESLEASK